MARTLPVLIAALMMTVALPSVAAADDDPDPEPPEIEWCEKHTEDPFGQPQILPYPCPKQSTSTDDPLEIEWCEIHTEDPFGQPQILPYPCPKQSTSTDDPVEVEWCEIHTEDPFGQPQILPYPCKVHTDTSQQFPPETHWCTDDEDIPGTSYGVAYTYPCYDQTQSDEDPVNVEICNKYRYDSKTGAHYWYPYPCTVDVNL